MHKLENKHKPDHVLLEQVVLHYSVSNKNVSKLCQIAVDIVCNR